ncbi:MAG: hypothetical protein M3Q45_06995 [Chloroflexota bacterium]|nr:hypothetical protein [Chloroflexota bacterium]
MTRATVLAWSMLLCLGGGGMLVYLLRYVPPTLPDAGWHWPMISLFITALALLVSGIGALGALAVHRRWPGLGGARRHGVPQPDTALRQGFLLGSMSTVLALLALFRLLDITFLLVTLLLAGLVEAYVQSRQTR